MSHSITLKVWGDYALFSRPEMPERLSYDVPTPSAARGILEAIYWKPQMRWIIDRIHVLKPIRFTNIRRNEVASQANSGHKIPLNNVRKAMQGKDVELPIFIEENRQQRASLVLHDVAYVIEAHCHLLTCRVEKDGPELEPNAAAGKHLSIFTRRAKNGQFHHHPVLGCREFTAFFELIESEADIPVSQITGDQDLGFMIYDIDFEKGAQPILYRPRLTNGIIDVATCFKNSAVLPSLSNSRA
jgi:CRISPR-associated protein Cas5d